MIDSRVRGLLVAAAVALAAGLLATTGSAGTSSAGKVGAQRAACLAHVVSQNRGYYTGDCTGHDEPELDPVSSAPHSARDLTWHIALPAQRFDNGVVRRADLLVRRHGRRLESREDRRAGIPRAAVLPRLAGHDAAPTAATSWSTTRSARTPPAHPSGRSPRRARTSSSQPRSTACSGIPPASARS